MTTYSLDQVIGLLVIVWLIGLVTGLGIPLAWRLGKGRGGG